MSEATCANCAMPLTGRYCAHCGQKATALRPTLHDAVHEAVHEFAHVRVYGGAAG